jgi:fatty acid desaturase
MPRVDSAVPFSFLEQQIITARNVRGGPITDFFMGALNHQTEHHLFPNTPRNKLRHLRPYVRRVSNDLGIVYTDVSLVETNRILLRELGAVAREARLAAPPLQPALVETGAD